MARPGSIGALLAAPLLAALLAAPATAGAIKDDDHRFGVIGHSFSDDGGEARLKRAIADLSEPSLAFVVATGIKSEDEPCSDRLYLQRLDLFDDARRPMIVAPAASDWSECTNSAGRSNAIERLNRLRELFFSQPESLGRERLELTRLSASGKFRSYAENAHWELGNVLYATINLPANNNHYLPEAGRNSEFEDRLVANRFWLNRLFGLAQRNNMDALVLFSEGDLKALAEPKGLRALLGGRPANRDDGFGQPRRQVAALAKKFRGKVLLIDTALPTGTEPTITWRDNLGHVSLGSTAMEVRVSTGAKTLFTLRSAHTGNSTSKEKGVSPQSGNRP